MRQKIPFFFCLIFLAMFGLAAGNKYLTLQKNNYLNSPFQWLTSHLTLDFKQINACYSQD